MSTQKRKFELFARLTELGFTYDEAHALRRIEMTLQRWAELECGTDRGCIERCEETPNFQLINWPDSAGNVWLVENRGTEAAPLYSPLKDTGQKDPNHFDAQRALRRQRALYIVGKAYMTYENGPGPRGRYLVADREAGALRRLAVIVAARNARVAPRRSSARFVFAYHQGDCRGCMLYLVTRGQLMDSGDKVLPVEQYYTRGLAVCT